MQIDKISKVAPSSAIWDDMPRQSKLAAPSFSSADPQLAAKSSSVGASSSGFSTSLDQVQSAAVKVRLPVLSAPHSTTVAGKNYSLSIEEAAGAYVASVPNPPGTSATGSSAQAAENNLDTKLDTLA